MARQTQPHSIKARTAHFNMWGALLVLAVLWRAFIPAGMMPSFPVHAMGPVKMVICTGTGSRTVDLPAGYFGHAGDQSGKHNEKPCAFAAAFGTGIFTPFLLLVLVVAFAAATYGPIARTLFPARRVWCHSARAPPSLF